MSDTTAALKKTSDQIEQAMALIADIRSMENEERKIESEMASTENQRDTKKIPQKQFEKTISDQKRLMEMAKKKREESEKKATALLDDIGKSLQYLKTQYNDRWQKQGIGKIE